MIIAIVVDPWKPQGSMGGDLLWEDLPHTCGLVCAAESAALAVCTPERLYVRSNGLHLVVGKTSQPFGCASPLVVDSECLSAYKCADVLDECVDACRRTSYEVSDMLLSLSRCVLP